MTTIRTYLCPKKLPATTIDGRSTSGGSSFDADNGILQTYLVKPSCNFNSVVRTSLISENTLASTLNFFTCLEDLMGEASLSWKRDVDNTELPGDEINVNRDTHITVDINKPEMRCFYSGVFLYGIKIDPSSKREIFDSIPSHTGGMIGTQSDFETQIEVANPQTLFVPGELLQLAWRIYVNDTIYRQPLFGKYFATPAVTGGEIIQANTIGGTIVSYVVDSQGWEITCVPTDYAEYVVGDWVYLLKQGSTSAGTCNRTSAFTDSDAEFDLGKDDEIFTGEIAELLMAINSYRGNSGVDMLEPNRFLQRAAENLAETLAEDEGATLYGLSEVSASGYLDGVMISGEDYEVLLLSGYGYNSVSAVMNYWRDNNSSTLKDSTVEDMGASFAETDDGRKAYVAVLAYRESERDLVVTPNEFRLIPMTVNDEGNETALSNSPANFDTLDYDMRSGLNFEKFFEMSVHVGEIIELVHESNQATVKIEEDPNDGEEGINGTFNNVPIFYHCEGSNAADGGHSAFEVGDSVIVINPGGRCDPHNVVWGESEMRIVGFTDRRRPCGGNKVLISTNSGSEAFVYDMETNSILVEKDTRENVLDQLKDMGFSSVVSGSPSGTLEIDSTHDISEEFEGPMNLPNIATYTKTESEPHGNADSDQTSWYFPAEDGEEYTYIHKWVENEDGEIRAPYVIRLGGLGTTTNFNAQSALTCSVEWWNSTSEEWEARDVVDWTRLYYHGMFHIDALEDGTAAYSNCETWMECIHDTWEDNDWWCTQNEDAPMNRFPCCDYDFNNYDGHIFTLWCYNQATDCSDHQSYQGPVPSIAAAWTEVGRADNGNSSLLYETVRVASDVDVSWSNNFGEITDIISGECSSCGDPTTTSKYRIPVLRLYAKLGDNVLTTQMYVLKNLLNEERTAKGKTALEHNISLVNMAEEHALYMANQKKATMYNEDYGHTLPYMNFDFNYALYMLKSDGTVVDTSDTYETTNLINDTAEGDDDYHEMSGVACFVFAHDITSTYDEPHTYKLALVEENGTIFRKDYELKQLTLDKVVEFWMASETRSELILDDMWTEIGLGAAKDEDGYTYIAVVFGFRYYHWPGYAAIDTTDLINYMETHFDYSNQDDALRDLIIELV